MTPEAAAECYRQQVQILRTVLQGIVTELTTWEGGAPALSMAALASADAARAALALTDPDRAQSATEAR